MSRYKVTLTSNTIYKEIELASDMQQVKVGTGVDCDVRLRKELFFGQIELVFAKNGDSWAVSCSDNMYLTVGDIRKLMTKKLVHGDVLEIKYQESDNLVFTLEFLIDFDDGKKKYERIIDVSGVNFVTIGASRDCNIEISGEFVKNDSLVLSKNTEGFVVDIQNTTYGVYINGKKAKSKAIIKDGDFLSLTDYFFYFKDSKIWTQIRPEMKINSLGFLDTLSKGEYPKFNRNTRIKTVVCKDDIEILDPPAAPQKPKNNLLTRLLPSMGMLIAAGVMAFFGGAMIIMSVISAGMAIFTSVLTLKQGNKEYKQSCEERIQKYNAYIFNKRKEIETCRADEKAVLDSLYISQDEEIRRFEVFSPSLFDRTPEDKDFLSVKLGEGAVEAQRHIRYKKQEKLEIGDELQLLPGRLCDEYRNINNAPVVCSFKDINAVGIVGALEDRYNVFKNIIIDIAARQYFQDVKMVFVAQERNADKIHWLRMLPQVSVDEQKIKTVVTDNESKNIVFEYLYKELTLRQQTKKHGNHIVIFLFDEYGFKSHPISKFVERAKELGVTFVFFGATTSDIPLGCERLISLNGANSGCLMLTEDNSKATEFIYTPISTEDAKKIVDLLTPVFSEEISLEGTLTRSISMFEMLNVLAVEDINLGERWKNSKVYKSMAAPLGVSKSGKVYLDLHDKAHGPHGLVAGTTGSGKSEILQTYILSMATLFHPHEVGFVIIDFKGGGMVNQFKNLSHLMGAITNIDGKEIDRSLKSIKAELQKRQRLFAEAEVNHIDKYIRKFKSGEVTFPLPHLIVIVDEFAELKAEQPEFMKELISAARIGRSLGVHLILATQKPSGQVNEQIWSNSKFKLCLKVQSQEDSNEVIKSPLAAEIKEPGRAYLQVGNNEIFELFQSAYSGAPEKMDDTSIKEFSIRSVSACGKRTPVYVQKRKKADGINTTQLDAIVEYVNLYSQKEGIERLPNICLPPLEKSISVPKELVVKGNSYPIGIYDDPDTQYQGEAYFDFDADNTIIVGASQTGKTNLLQLIVREIASQKKANEASFYIIDFGSMILKNFEELNHIGGVVLSSEEEKLKNLFKLLLQELDVRKEKLMSVGVSSISSYNEAGYNDIPHLYVILENFAVFRELYADKYEDDFLFIAREGITYGISLIVTATTTSGFGYKYMSNFANHIALTCNDNSEYSNLFDRCRTEPSNMPGRVLVCFNKAIYEAQTYLSFDGEKEIDRISAIKAFIAEQNNRNAGMRAKRIPEVPDVLEQSYIYDNFAVNVQNQIAVSLNYQQVEPVYFDITSMPQLTLVGKLTANMVGFEKALINEIKMSYFDRPADVYIIDSLSRDLAKYAEEPFVEEYSIDYSMLSTIFENVSSKLEERYSEVLEEGLEVLDNKPLLFVLINNASAIEYISTSKELMSMYTSIVTKYKAMKVMLVFGGINDEAIGYSSGDLLKKLKENKNAMIFTNLAEHKVFDVPAAFIRANKKPIDASQGYYLRETEIVKIRFAREE